MAVRSHLEGALARAVGILQVNRAELDEGAASLLAHETLGAEELPKVAVEGVGRQCTDGSADARGYGVGTGPSLTSPASVGRADLWFGTSERTAGTRSASRQTVWSGVTLLFNGRQK